MANSSIPLDQAIKEIDQLRKHLNRQKARQITATAVCELIRAHSLAWSHNHKSQVQSVLSSDQFKRTDELHERLLTSTYKATSRSAYLSLLKDLRAELLQLQNQAVAKSTASVGSKIPDFSKIARAEMSKLLARRVQEVVVSIDRAPLAATIMMGALLEALFLARINMMPDKRPIFSLKATPRDKAGKARELKDWGLNDFIEVSHEHGWIRKSAKDISVVLRDYRNIIHPVKELTMIQESNVDVLINTNDARMFWRIFCELSEQIVESVN